MAIQFAAKYSCIVVLKGPRTVVACSDGDTYINNTGNAGMAKAGMGDVLTGIIASLLAQGVCEWDAARSGVYLHGKIGDELSHRQNKFSFIATDMIEQLKEIKC